MPASRTPTAPALGPRARARLLAALGLAGLLGGMLVVVLGSDDDNGQTASAAATTPAATTVKTVVVKKPATVKLVVRGVGAYDPEGDGTENGDQAPLATDGDPATAWKSERYRSTFRKSGVGLVIDAGGTVKATKLVLTTDTPGYSAQIQAGPAATGPFTPISSSTTTSARTVFALKPIPARYLVVWVTSMPVGGAAAVNEVTVAGRR